VQLIEEKKDIYSIFGILFMLLTALIQAFIALTVKTTTQIVSINLQIIAYYCVPLFFLLPLAFIQFKETIKTNNLALHFLRGLFSYCSVYSFFYAIKCLPLGISATLFNSIPLFVPIVSRLILKEKLSIKNYFGLGIALIGVLFILNPKFDTFSPQAVLIGLFSAILMACSSVLLRKLALAKEPVKKIVFYQYLSCSCFTILSIAIENVLYSSFKGAIFKNVSWIHTNLLILLGCLSWSAQVTFSKASFYLPASKLAPFFYASVPISSLLGYLFLAQKIHPLVFIGSGFIFLGIYFCTHQGKYFNFKNRTAI